MLAGWTTKTEILVASLQELQLHYMQRPKQRRRPSYMQILLHECVEKFQRSHTRCFPGKPVSLPSSLGRLALQVKRLGGKNKYLYFLLFSQKVTVYTRQWLLTSAHNCYILADGLSFPCILSWETTSCVVDSQLSMHVATQEIYSCNSLLLCICIE